jgi:GTP pyrophosphokinase
MISRAYEFAKEAHKGVKRKSGEPYIIHPVGAAHELMVIEPDLTSILAALVHDTVSDGTATFADIEKNF